ncbi:hypothetical protein WJU23_05245 [Prosthecobacter sp. SYSU 5D2]|uniref:hypothetical protein n=1 Tax=Prosthecobacter sp. SYSU 5D2 TaxID=3134134 RepID=UPI0031FF1B53
MINPKFAGFGSGGGGGGGGGDPITDPNVAYVRTDGNDTTGDGSPGAPFLTLQKAVNEGFTRFDLGVGSFGNVNFDANASIYIRGHHSTVGTLTNYGRNLHITAEGAMEIGHVIVSGIDGNPNGGQVIIKGGAGLTVASVQFTGGYDTATEAYGSAGSVELIGPFQVVNSIEGGADVNEDGTVLLARGVDVPPITAVAVGDITVRLAIINEIPYVDNSLL